MRYNSLSSIILSANIIVYALSPAAYAQDSGDIEPGTVVSETPPETPATQDEDAIPPVESAFSPPQRTYNAPKGEAGPDVDDQYNNYTEGGEGLLGDLRIGPVVALGLPHPLTYGVEGLYAKFLSFGFNTGSYSVTQIDKANIKIKNWDVYTQWHPFLGSFFVGAAYGHQDITGRFEDDIKATISLSPTSVPTRIDAEIKSNYFTPRIGWLAVWDSGFTIGFELGVQIPLSPKTKVDVSMPSMSAGNEAQVKATEDYKDLKKQADDAVELLGKKTFPYLTLLKMGWLF